MTNTLQNTINWARPFIQYEPVTAGFGQEPAVSIASMIRNSMLNAPMTWPWNRNELTFSTVVGTQDYPQAISGSDFAFIENVTLTDDQGSVFQLKDVYNNSALAVSSFQQRPSAVAAQSVYYTAGAQYTKFRFLGVPDAIYTATVEYQKLSPSFGPFFITAVAAASGSPLTTAYTGTFDPYSLPVNATVTITGCAASANNGTFVVVTCTTTTLTVKNTAGTAATSQSGYVVNFSWVPIPDQYSDVYNNLFLAEILSLAGDARAQLYRQRGVAAMISKATGLTEMQKSAFSQQWLARDTERQVTTLLIQQGNAVRGV